MFLKSTTINNFRIHKNIHLEFDKINVLIGKNGSGKSSVLQALCWALYGSVTTKAKKADLLRNGAKEGSVDLEFDNGYHIYRNFKGSVSLYDSSAGDKNILLSKDSDLKEWINISRETFFNIIYGAQNEMCSFFQNFNAKEKDFIDNIIIPNNPCENILINLDFLKKQLNETFMYKRNAYQNRTQAEKYKSSMLESNGFNSIEEISNKISELDAKINSLKEIENVISLKENIESATYMLNHQIQQYENSQKSLTSLKETYSEIFNITSSLKNNLISKLEISENDISNARNIVNHKFNLTETINKMISILENPQATDPNNIGSLIEFIKNGLNYITKIDENKSKYYNLISEYERKEYELKNHSTMITNENNSIVKLEENINNIKNNLNVLHEKFNNLTNGKEIKYIIDEYNSLKIERQKFVTFRDSLQSYENTLNTYEIINENEIDLINTKLEKLNIYKKIFDRDGFMSYIRNYMLEEIALKTDSFLKNFGFDDLFPVYVKKGELIFNGKSFSLLSGGQQIITAIILRIIFARIISPGMKWNTIILDEPTTGVDEYRIPMLKDYFSELSMKLSLQLFIITHHEGVIPTDSNIIRL